MPSVIVLKLKTTQVPAISDPSSIYHRRGATQGPFQTSRKLLPRVQKLDRDGTHKSPAQGCGCNTMNQDAIVDFTEFRFSRQPDLLKQGRCLTKERKREKKEKKMGEIFTIKKYMGCIH